MPTNGPPSLYRGVYINLDRSTERRERFDAQLLKFGLAQAYARFSAIDGSRVHTSTSRVNPGELGCFLSHVRALELARGFGKPVHILEDDAILSEHVQPIVEDAIEGRVFDHFDIIFTDTFVNCHLAMLKSMKSAFDSTPPKRPLRLADVKIIDLSK